jgi:hypothetical protein
MLANSIHGPQYSQYLHLEVNTISIQQIQETSRTSDLSPTRTSPLAIDPEPSFDTEIVVNDPQQKEITIRCKLTLTRKVERASKLYEKLCTQPWCGILFGRHYIEPKSARSRGAFVMVIDQLDGYWERIGHLNLIDIEAQWGIQASQLFFSLTKRRIRLG